jgi:hypothetical protein
MALTPIRRQFSRGDLSDVRRVNNLPGPGAIQRLGNSEQQTGNANAIANAVTPRTAPAASFAGDAETINRPNAQFIETQPRIGGQSLGLRANVPPTKRPGSDLARFLPRQNMRAF